MRTLFELGTLTNNPSGSLLMELGQDYCLLSQLDADTQLPLFARLWAFDATDTRSSLANMHTHLEQAGISAAQCRIATAFPELVVLPASLSVEPAELLRSVFPGHSGTAFLHRSGEHQYAFGVPALVLQALKTWGAVQLVPAQACMPAADPEGNGIYAFFIDSHFRVAVYSRGRLQLAQQYSFTAPLDVVYYLLKICSEFGLSQQDTLLAVSGFIAPESALYKEVHQYFLNIRFAFLETLEVDGQAVPKHYFSSLYNLAACAL